MARENFATRPELLRRLRARLGASTNAAIQVQTTEWYNEELRLAAEQIRNECEWKRTVVEYYFATGIDQRFYNYPPNSGPGDIKRVWLWQGDDNGGEYVEIFRRNVFANLENDPSLIGAPEIATRGQPQIYEESSQQVGGVPVPALKINPLPDVAYKMRVDFVQGAQLTDDVTPCIVDADCIVAFAFAAILDHRGHEARADKIRSMAMRDLKKKAGAQRVARTRKTGLGDTIQLKAGVRWRTPPNFDTSASVLPS